MRGERERSPSKSCSAMKKEIPSSEFKEEMREERCLFEMASKGERGSSKRTRSGLWQRAQARAQISTCPLEREEKGLSKRWLMPKKAKTSKT